MSGNALVCVECGCADPGDEPGWTMRLDVDDELACFCLRATGGSYEFRSVLLREGQSVSKPCPLRHANQDGNAPTPIWPSGTPTRHALPRVCGRPSGRSSSMRARRSKPEGEGFQN
jgi:hypothetical protein